MARSRRLDCLVRRASATTHHRQITRYGSLRSQGRHRHQPPKRMSSSSEDDTDGTCSPSEAREMATRVLLKTLSMPGAPCAFKWLRSSAISTLFWPLESSPTLPGVAEVRISALSGA